MSQSCRRNTLAVAPAYSPFLQTIFGAAALLLWVLSWESEVETQSSVRGIIYSSTRQHHRYNDMSHLCLSSASGKRKLSGANLSVKILAAGITPCPTVNTGQHKKKGALLLLLTEQKGNIRKVRAQLPESHHTMIPDMFIQQSTLKQRWPLTAPLA